MKDYTQLKEERRQKYNELFNSLGVFYAFSNQQFEEGKKKNPLIEEGEKYVRLGMGGFIRKGNVEKLFAGIAAIDKQYKSAAEEVKENKKRREAMIVYELGNYEAWYTGDITDTYEALKEVGITKEEVLSVYKKNYKLHTSDL